MRAIDLHIHSSFSEDADYSVEEIFSLAEGTGLAALSITDHDSLESIAPAIEASKNYKIEYAPGIELTTVFPLDGSQQHILGYFIDEGNSSLTRLLEEIHGFRASIAKRRMEALRRIGFAIDERRVREMVGGRAPAATSIICEALDNPGNAKDPRLSEYRGGAKSGNRVMHFYAQFFTEGSPAYVPFESVDTESGVRAIREAGGVAVLAHPVFLKDRSRLDVIRDYGIRGIEAISSYHGAADTDFFFSYAEKNGLCATAGSDFHGPTTKPKVAIGGINGNDYPLYERLKEEKKRGR